MSDSTDWRKWAQAPICPLCMKAHSWTLNGWQLLRETLVPLEARTWAKNKRDSIWWAKESKLLSFQAGKMSLKTPGVFRCPYQATPKPSPLVVHWDSLAERLCLIKEFS